MNNLFNIASYANSDQNNPVNWRWQRRVMRAGQPTWGEWEDFAFSDSPFIGLAPGHDRVQVRFYVSAIASEGIEIPVPDIIEHLGGIIRQINRQQIALEAQSTVAMAQEMDADGTGSRRVE